MPMQRVSGSIPNLINGISQQAPALRLSTQGKAQTNFYDTVVEGKKDRPPTEFIAKIMTSIPDGMFVHTIDRDETEKYVVTFDDTNNIRVFDFDGVEKTVNAPDGWAYVTLGGTVSPENRLRALTVADYTFIVNRRKVVAQASTTSATRDKEALINVEAGNYGKDYKIYIDGVVVAHYTTPNGENPSSSWLVDTTNIAQVLIDGTANTAVPAGFTSADWPDGTEGHAILSGGVCVKNLNDQGINAANGWTVERYGNAIYLQKDTGDFEIKVEDGFNGHAMKAAKDRVQKFTDLPNFGPDGFVIEITGDPGVEFDNYWVKFEENSAGPGVWRETVKPGVKTELDAGSMPHILVRESDGTFTFQEATWDDLKAGDGDEICPFPSFIGQRISQALFNRNRLGFLSDENVIQSRSGSYFNFFNKTATALLDDDPIDTAVSHVKVSILHAALPFNDDLLLFSDSTEFVLKGNEILTPKTASIRPRSEYVIDPDVMPVAIGSSVFFSSKRNDYAAVWEYAFLDSSGNVVPDVDEITSHVPSYIPAGVFKIAGTPNESVLVALTSGDPGALYVYKYYWSKQQKLQASWSRWTFPHVDTILNADFIGNELYLLFGRDGGGVSLEKMKMQPSSVDSGLDFTIALDRRISSEDLAAPVYDAINDTTTFTLPYTAQEDIVAVTAPGSEVETLELEIVSLSTTDVEVSGDHTGDIVLFGFPYERRYELSRIYKRLQSRSGGSTAIESGRLQIRNLHLAYSKTGYFRVEVTPEGRDTFSYEFNSRVVGNPANVPDTIPLRSGSKKIPILSRNDRVTIEIVNDSWMPSAFLSAEWYGTLAEVSRE